MAELLPVEQQIAQTLQAGHALSVRWDCGGDESFVYTQLDGQEIRADYGNSNDLAYLLDQYLTDLLQLPDAGEFAMEGTGRIFREGPAVLIEYQSRAMVYWEDFGLTDEELRELGVELPDRPALPTDSEAPALGTAPTGAEESQEEADKIGEEEEEDAGTFDQDMSDEYSGRRVLFMLP